MKDRTIEVRDRRKRDYFTIDNEIIDDYPDITAYGIVVYAVLCREADNGTQECKISLPVLAEKCRISRSSVWRAIANLADIGLIFVETIFDSSNKYIILPVKKRRDTENTPVSAGHYPPCQQDTTPCPTDTLNKTLNKTKTTTPPVRDGEDSLDTSSEEKDSPRARVRRVFAYYLEKFGRRPTMYELTSKRMKIGLDRLEDCTRKCGGDINKAEELMRVVVDELSDSEFHNGKNDAKKPYIDWIAHLFKSTERLEWWLERMGVK